VRDGTIVEDGPFEGKRLAGRQAAFLPGLLFELAAVAGLEEGIHG